MTTTSKKIVGRSKRVRVDEAEAFRAVADYTYDWESWIDPTGRTLWVNPAVKRKTGYTVEECLAMADYPLPIVHGDDRETIREVLAGALGGSSGNDLEFRIVTRTGLVRWMAISWQSIEASDGRPLGYRSSIRNIHERKLAEERLREATRVAERAAVTRGEFLAHMSHELRTPIQCIEGYAELLLQGRVSVQQQRYLKLMRDQTRALLKMVDDVLDLSALEAVTSTLADEVFDIHAAIGAAMQAFVPMVQGRPVTLRTQIDPAVPRLLWGDPHRLRQILANLIGNAVKFTEEGEIVVRASVEETDQPAVVGIRIAVCDTGEGIDAALLEMLFEPFVQSRKRAPEQPRGTGLGLPISRRLCEVMGGRIEVESREHRGSTFTIHLPFKFAGAERAVKRGKQSPISGWGRTRGMAKLAKRVPLSILVVDDSAAVREILVEFLRLMGYQPDEADTGREAVRRAQSKAYDAILMDLQLPDLDGMSAARLIRASQPVEGPRPMMVAITANLYARSEVLSSEGGMDLFMPKPVRPADLARVLHEIGASRPPSLSSQVMPAVPSQNRAALDPRVIRDLTETISSDGRPLLDKIARRIVAETRELLAAVQQSHATGQSDAGALLHKIKGNCLMIGAHQTAQLAQDLSDLPSETITIKDRSLQKLVESFDRVVAALAERTSLDPAPDD